MSQLSFFFLHNIYDLHYIIKINVVTRVWMLITKYLSKILNM